MTIVMLKEYVWYFTAKTSEFLSALQKTGQGISIREGIFVCLGPEPRGKN
jgi:hypothetical protein